MVSESESESKSTYVHIALQVFAYSSGSALLFVWLFTNPRSQLSIGLTAGSLGLTVIQSILFCTILRDDLFLLFEFIILCASTASLVWTQTPLQQQLPWVISTLAILIFFLLEAIFYCVISLRTSDLGYFGRVHQVLWIIPQKLGFAIGLIAIAVRTEGEKVATAVEELARVAGGLAGAVAGGAVQGASAVAGGVATVMAACHGEEYTPLEEPAQDLSLLPPPYFDIANNDFALREVDKLQV